MTDVDKFFKNIGTAAAIVHDTVKNMFESAQPILDGIAHLQVAKKSLEPSGLLPHITTPWNKFDANQKDTFAGDVIQHYQENWSSVEEKFQSLTNNWDVLPETKDAFFEALSCHKYGLYKSVVLTIFPTIEAEFRNSFQKDIGDPAASLKELKELAENIPAGYLIAHVAPLRLFDVFNAHIYDQVKTPEALARFEKDPVPNRHAAIHGIIDYNKEIHSINSIILADYIFFLITQCKKAAADFQKNQTSKNPTQHQS